MWPFNTTVNEPERRQYTVAELFDEFDIVDVSSDHIVATQQLSDAPDLRELGSTGGTLYGSVATEDYNPALRGNSGMKIFDQMRKNDGQVKSSLRTVKTPVLSGRWYMEPASDKKQDRTISEYVENNLFKWMSTSWPQFLSEALLSLDFGYYPFETVFARNPHKGFEGKIMWQKFAPRHPLNIEEWYYDAHGGPKGIKYSQTSVNTGTRVGPTSNYAALWNTVDIPIDKLLVFTNEKEAGNMQGVSILRSAYKHWYYKENLYKVDAIQKERHGIGIPIIKLPPNFTPSDKQLANEIGRNLRTNERAHVVLPPMWEIEFADLKGNPVDAMTSIEHHDKMISRNILGESEANSSDEMKDLFIKSTRTIADTVRDVFNKYAIPKLVNYNWPGVTDYPELRVRRIGESQDWRTVSFAMRNFAGAKFITPDDKLEDWLREELDLPKFDEATARIIDTPQAPGEEDPKAPKADMPKQSKAADMKQQAQGAGKSNVGTDTSGGK